MLLETLTYKNENMRPSSYNIIVKVDDEAKRYALLNSYTHAFDIVNQNVYQYLKNEKSDCDISEDTKEKLIKRGYITSLSKEDERELVKRLLDKIYDEVRLKHFGFHFIISYDCNLRCVYCYEDPILNGCACLPKCRITKEQVDKAYEIIVEKDKNKTGRKVIHLYGGEPFMAENYEMLEYIVQKGKILGYVFSVTSNGYDLDKYLDYLEANSKIFSFQITIDGVESIHNERKPHYKNNDSFTKITSNINCVLKMGIPISIRINTDPYTMERANELLDYFKEKGWYQYKNFKAYYALLRKEVPIKGKNGEYSKEMFTQSDFYRAYVQKGLEKQGEGKILCQDYSVNSVLTNLLLGKFVPYKSCFCGAQSGMIIFDPLGDIYSCWDVVGQRENRVGRYIPDFKLEDTFADKWFDARVSKYSCIKCKYVLFCGGGCLANAMRTTGNLQSGTCNDYPRLFNVGLQHIYNEKIKKGLDES